EQLASALPRRPRGEAWLRELRTREQAKAQRQAEYERSDQIPIHHFRLAKELDTVARAAGDSMFVADGGNWVAIAAKVIGLRKPGRWLDPGPLGCLGVGAPFAIAARLLHPDRPVFVIQGDGSFGFNGMDFDTALRFKLPMVAVVGNDAAWGQIRLPQVQLFGPEKSPATQLSPTRYDKVVEALGGHGEHVTEPAQIRPALERAVASGTVACVNVLLDQRLPPPAERKAMRSESTAAADLALDRANALLLVVDVQERLVTAMPQGPLAELVKNARVLIRAARRLGIPVVATEQYPKGLGPTVASLRELLPAEPMTKLEFSCGASKEIARHILAAGRKQV